MVGGAVVPALRSPLARMSAGTRGRQVQTHEGSLERTMTTFLLTSKCNLKEVPLRFGATSLGQVVRGVHCAIRLIAGWIISHFEACPSAVLYLSLLGKHESCILLWLIFFRGPSN